MVWLLEEVLEAQVPTLPGFCSPAPAALERGRDSMSMGPGNSLSLKCQDGDERVPAIITRSPPSLPLLRTKAKAARSCSKEAVLAHTWTWVVWLAQNYPCREACTSDSRLQLGVLIFCALWYMSVSPKYRARYSKPSSAKKRRQDQGLGQSWLSRMEQEVRTMVPQIDWLVDTQPVGG